MTIIASGACGDNLTWQIDDDTYTLIIEGYGDMYDYTSMYDVPWFEYRDDFFDYSLPDGITSIGDYAFYYALLTIESYTLPSSVVRIGKYAFANIQLTGFTIPDGVETIEEYAFAGCYYLSSLSIPASVSSIGAGIVQGCSRLSAIQVDANSNYFKSDGGVLLNKSGTTLVACPPNKTGTYIVPSGVVTIKESAFYNTSLSDVTLPEGLQVIEAQAFLGYRHDLDFPSSITTIGEAAFFGAHLSSIYISANVLYIGADAFAACYSLTTITMMGIPTTIASWTSFALGSSSNPVSCIVYSPDNLADGALDRYSDRNTTFTYLPIVGTDAKKLTWSNTPIQVESAIRDGTGQIIKDKCARHATFSIDTDEPDSDNPPTWEIPVSSLGLRSGELPRMVQIFDASGKEVGAEVNISATQITVNLIDAPADETWTAQVTAW